MDFLNWYDFLTPTNPIASIFFGIITTSFVAVTIWVDTNKWRATGLAAAIGLIITFAGVFLLNFFGYYG